MSHLQVFPDAIRPEERYNLEFQGDRSPTAIGAIGETLRHEEGGG